MSRPLVSVCSITYNQKDYIAQCIKSILNQNTDFEFEIVINDDNSTDGTSQSCEQILQENPTRSIKYKRNAVNLGMIGNWVDCINRSAGKYIALCEGDDYWTDPFKLQKQVDFLEANNDFSICYHRVNELFSGSSELKPETLNTSESEKVYTIEDLAKGNLIHTPSVVFRNGLVKEFPEWFSSSPVADYIIHMLNARHGKIKYLPNTMAVYRRHDGGIWARQSPANNYSKWLKMLLSLLDEFKNEENVKVILRQQLFSVYEIFKGVCITETDIKKLFETTKCLSAENSFFTSWWMETYFEDYIHAKLSVSKLQQPGLRDSIIMLQNNLKRKFARR